MSDERRDPESLSGELDRKLEWALRCATTDLGLALREALRGFDARRLRERALARRPVSGDAPGFDEATLVLAALAVESLAAPHEDAEATVDRCLAPAWLRAAGVCLESVTLRPGVPVTEGHRALTRDLPVEDLGGGGPFVVWDSFATVTRAARLGWVHTDSPLRVRNVTESEIALLRSVPGTPLEEGGGPKDAREALRVRIDAAMAILSGDESELPEAEEGSGPGSRVPRAGGRSSRVNLLGSTVVTSWGTPSVRQDEQPEATGGRRPLLWGGGVAVVVLVVLAAWLGWKALNPPDAGRGTGAVASRGGAPEQAGAQAGTVPAPGADGAEVGASAEDAAASVVGEQVTAMGAGAEEEMPGKAATEAADARGAAAEKAAAETAAAEKAAAERAAAEKAAAETAAAEKAAAEKVAAEKAAAETAAAEGAAAEKAAAETAAAERAAAEKAAAERAAAEKAAAEKAAAEKAAAEKAAAEKAAAEKAAAETVAAEKAAAEKAAAEKAAAETAAAEKAAAEKAAAEKAAAEKAAAEKAAAEKAAAEKAAAEKAAAAKAAAEKAAAEKAAAAKAAAEKAAAEKAAAEKAAAERAAAQKAAANVPPGKLPAGFKPTLRLSRLAKLYAGDDGRAIKLREWPGGKQLMDRCAVQGLAPSEATFRIYQGYRPGRLLCTGDLRPFCDALGCPPGATCEVGMAWLQGCGH